MIAKRHLVAACLFALATASTGPSRASQDGGPAVPAEINVPEGNRVFFVLHAIGTQNYICLPRTASPGLEWVLTGPQATLLDDELGQVVTHFLSVNPEEAVARATWEHSKDSSAVWALADRTSTDSAYVQPGAIAWLRLRAVGHQAGPTGGDRMTGITWIQRVSTTGGKAPAGDCPNVGARTFVPYGADYVFWRAQ